MYNKYRKNVNVIGSWKIRLAGHVVRMALLKIPYLISWKKCEGTVYFGDGEMMREFRVLPRKNNVGIDSREIGW
jgi:hypothetical protein